MQRTLLVLAAVVMSVPFPRSAMADDAAALRARAASAHARVIPPWARKYNMNCSGCHYPTVPRLNARGLRFKWAGYRMPDEIGEAMEVKRIAEYFGVIGIVEYAYTRTEGQPADANGLTAPAASIFGAGSLGKNYGGFLEFAREAEGTIDLVGQFVGVWGKEDAFGGVRAGQGHFIAGGAIAGFDRPVGILKPLPLSTPTTAGNPFRFAGDVAAIEAFYVLGARNRASIQLANGLTATPGGMPATPSTSQDWVLTDQFMWDDRGGGLMAVGYFGTIAGLDSSQAGVRSRYTRFGISANKYFGPVEALVGYTASRDTRLPLGPTSPFTADRLAGSGYWLSGTYTAKSYLSFYGRYELLDPDSKATGDALRRIVLGGVLPFNVPEYFRFGLEYFRDVPEASTSPRRNGAAAELRFAF